MLLVHLLGNHRPSSNGHENFGSVNGEVLPLEVIAYHVLAVLGGYNPGLRVYVVHAGGLDTSAVGEVQLADVVLKENEKMNVMDRKKPDLSRIFTLFFNTHSPALPKSSLRRRTSR
jgi:hypothetical protein